MIRKGEKIIHVHFLVSHKNYYFGSVTAMFKMFTEKDIGYSLEYISRQYGRNRRHDQGCKPAAVEPPEQS